MSIPIEGIAGLSGRLPIGAVLTVGHKGPNGAPCDTDRFFIVAPQECDGIRALHPSFAAFNSADPDKRKVIRGNLIFSSASDCWTHSLRAQVLPGGKGHPRKRPVCEGDGAKARRWKGPGVDDYADIVCPNDRCEFRQQTDAKKPVPCKPSLRFYFQPRWADVVYKDANGAEIGRSPNPLPTPAMKLTSGSWHNASVFKGFFDYIAQQAAELGAHDYSLYGLPFVITLSKKKRSGDGGGRAFPILGLSHEVDLQRFLLGQQASRKQLGGDIPPRLQLPDSERAPQVIDADYRNHTPGVATSARDDDSEETP